MTTTPANEIAIDASQFAANDNVGADSSLFLRAARLLIRGGKRGGKPIGQLTLLSLPTAERGALPFGGLTITKDNRVVFWPVLPRNTDMVASAGQPTVLDHLTLELLNKTIHATAYNAAGDAEHYDAADFGHSQSWRLQHLEGTGLSFWFSLLVRWSVLENQDLAVQRLVSAPVSDGDRRKTAFARYASEIKPIDVPVARGPTSGDYVYCGAYVVTDPQASIQLSSVELPMGTIAGKVDGFGTPENVECSGLKLTYAKTQFLFVTACPPGRMRDEIAVAFPRKRLSSKADT